MVRLQFAVLLYSGVNMIIGAGLVYENTSKNISCNYFFTVVR